MLDEARSEFVANDDFADPGDMARAIVRFQALEPHSEAVPSGLRSKGQEESCRKQRSHQRVIYRPNDDDDAGKDDRLARK